MPLAQKTNYAIFELEWCHVDASAGTLALPKVKGGARQAHPVGKATMELIAAVERVDGSLRAFPRRSDPGRHISAEMVENAWQRLGRQRLRHPRSVAAQGGDAHLLVSYTI